MLLSTAEIESRPYMMEAINDISPLRVILWPRNTGKTSLLAYEMNMLINMPDVYTIIIHSNGDEGKAFSDLCITSDMKNDKLINVSLDTLPTHAEKILDLVTGHEVYVFLSEIDTVAIKKLVNLDGHYVVSDEVVEDVIKEPSVLSTFLSSLCSDESVFVRQLTYIGTPRCFDEFTPLIQMAGLVPVVHTVHPREVWGKDWYNRAMSLYPIFECKNEFKAQILGLF